MLRPPANAFAAFLDNYGHDAALAADAGGRVNLIGEHVDYHDGLVLPLALSLRTWALVRPRDDGKLRIATRHFFDHVALETSALDGSAEALQARLEEPWHRYVVGPLWALRAHGVVISGADVWIDGELPLGGGLSSSAAIEVSLVTAFAALAGATLQALDVAVIAQRAERAVAAVPCGIMDQLASAHGSADGRALCIDCRTLTVRPVTLRSSLAVLVVDSGVRHALASSEYGRRQAECATALQALGIARGRDVDHAALAKLSGVGLKRLRHVVTEIERVQQAVQALETGDHAAFGALLYASHASLRDDYEVSCKELDAIVEAARGIDGVIGARMTGGGFGGNAVVVAERAKVGRVRAALGKTFSVREVSAGSSPSVWRA